MANWDESKHPRGKTTKASRGGSFRSIKAGDTVRLNVPYQFGETETHLGTVTSVSAKLIKVQVPDWGRPAWGDKGIATFSRKTGKEAGFGREPIVTTISKVRRGK